MLVIKRSGAEVEFDPKKIYAAVARANTSCEKPEDQLYVETEGEYPVDEIQEIVNHVVYRCNKLARAVNVEEIQDMVEEELAKSGHFNLARNYITYRYNHAEVRKTNTTDKKILALLNRTNEEAKQENANKNPIIASTQRDYMAGEVSKDITRRFLLPEDIWSAHEKGIIHFHDADYFSQTIHNCDLLNLEDMLQNGTVISGTKIERPHSFATACNIATQIIAQVASVQYGGQTITLSHLAPFVDVSRQRYLKEVREEHESEGIQLTDTQIAELAEKRVRREIKAGIQTIQYQILTLMTTNGQAPFVTVFMYLDEVPEGQTRDDLAIIIEEMLHQRIQGVKNEQGVWITPAFPKLIYALDEDNIHEDSKYFYLTKLAAECTAKRMVPDYISAKLMRELKGDVYPCMGCRSFLTPDRFTDTGNFGNPENAGNYQPGVHKYYGRFNQGVVTINLVDVACSSYKDMDKFWEIMNERLELCHRALRIRHERLLGTPSDVAPILWQHGALARLKKGETIDKLLYNGYSTISLGYGGLAECVYYMTGLSHTSPEGREFGLKVMQALNDACAKWKAEENIDYSVYGTPMESTTYKFAKCLQERFGMIPNVTDHTYITNSYHISVREEINAFDKLTQEAAFQRLSPGGAISYVEVPNMLNNIPAVLAVMKHIYNTLIYGELNTKSDYCQECGYEGEIEIVENEHHKLIWRCPQCGNTNHDKMNTARRVCGYIGNNDFNQGRMGDVHDRVLHL